MVFEHRNSKGKLYFLHKHKTKTFYFFCEEKRDTCINCIPEGFEIVEYYRTGFPMLRRKKNV